MTETDRQNGASATFCLLRIVANYSEGDYMKKVKIIFLSLLIVLLLLIKPTSLLYADTDSEEIQLSLPDKTWALGIDLSDFKIENAEFNKGVTGRMLYAINSHTGIIISIFLEKAAFKGDSKVCREYYWNKAKQSPFQKDDLKFSEVGEKALVEYMIKTYQGITVNQKNVNAYMSKDDVWIDIHLSKTNFTPKDEELFNAILKSVNFTENYIPSRYDYFGFGSAFYLQKNYQKAIIYYEKVLELEKRERRLERDLWRILVDNLGMAYGISGNLQKAKETFEYGIANDQTYPLFYYNLACAYAEMNDLDKAIDNLQKAFLYKHNIIEGENMPDPKTDSSFVKFMKNETFLAILETLK